MLVLGRRHAVHVRAVGAVPGVHVQPGAFCHHTQHDIQGRETRYMTRRGQDNSQSVTG